MTREAMIKVLRYKAEHIKAKIRPEFFAEVADMLEQDCVSRAELKKWLDMNFSFGGASRKFELFDRLDKELPPVTPQPKTDVRQSKSRDKGIKPRTNSQRQMLDKVKAEIKALSPEPTAYDVVDGNPIKDAVWETLADVLRIVDKYREENRER